MLFKFYFSVKLPKMLSALLINTNLKFSFQGFLLENGDFL